MSTGRISASAVPARRLIRRMDLAPKCIFKLPRHNARPAVWLQSFKLTIVHERRFTLPARQAPLGSCSVAWLVCCCDGTRARLLGVENILQRVAQSDMRRRSSSQRRAGKSNSTLPENALPPPSIADRFATGWCDAGVGGGGRSGGARGRARGGARGRRRRGGGSRRRDRHRHLLAQQRGHSCRHLLSDRLGAGAAVRAQPAAAL